MKKQVLLFFLLWSVAAVSQCNYSFVMTDSGNNGWNGNTMNVIQNGVTVATIGSTFTSGGGPEVVQVPLADNVSFQLKWNLGGTSPTQIGVEIKNPFGDTVYRRATNSASQQGAQLYSGMAVCSPSACIRPTSVNALNITGTSAAITWPNDTGASSWRVLVLKSNLPSPLLSDSGTICTTNQYQATALTCGTGYTAYVKSICGTSSSGWQAVNFSTVSCSTIITAACMQAQSLCDSFGLVHSNTTGSGNTGTMGCLSTTPNSSWFYFSVSAPGQVNLRISQSTLADVSQANLDADYIIYGPYSEPLTPCNGQLTPDKIVGCSYSAAAIENPSFIASEAGKYYYLMVTNFSDDPGYIKIDRLATTTASLDCTGFRLEAFIDTNSNGIKDNGEVNFQQGQFSYQKNNAGDLHNVVSSTGILNIIDPQATNTYDFGFQINSEYTPFYTLVSPTYNDVSLTSAGINQVNFPVVSTSPFNDVSTYVYAMGQPRPGFDYKNKIVYTNNGNQIANGAITFTKDAALSVTSVSQSGTVATANGFTYDFTNLQPFETRTIEVTMQVPTIPTVQLGALLTNSVAVSILPTVDVIADNNTSGLTQEVIGSYDPNDIMEAHGEQIVHAGFTSDEYLYYTIRFENTGTASAINVKVNNVLDAKLDETSLKMVGSSHDFVMDRVGTDINWSFRNILLAATSQNPNNSKGYIVYRIKPKPGYAVGDIIPSTASIYFDFNPAIVTNTFNTEFVTQLGVNAFESNSVAFYPNPVKDLLTINVKDLQDVISTIAVYDLYGKMVYNTSVTVGQTSQVVDLSNLQNGMYLIEVTTKSNFKTIKKLIVE